MLGNYAKFFRSYVKLLTKYKKGKYMCLKLHPRIFSKIHSLSFSLTIY